MSVYAARLTVRIAALQEDISLLKMIPLNGSVPRDDVEEHMTMCPLELIQCEYHVVGCEE